jgi:hypothetical protein
LKRASTILLAAVAGGAGAIVLLSYFLPDLPYLAEVSQWLKRTAVLLSAAALLVGLVNLIGVHLGKIGGQEKGWAYSALLVVMLAVTFTLGMLFGLDNRAVVSLFRYVQLPVEATLIALLAISLTAAGYRLIARRPNPFNIVFMVSAVVFILGSAPWLILPGLAEPFGVLRTWLAEVWAVGGARGLLLGVALGSITAGLRVLLAADRPYGD